METANVYGVRNVKLDSYENTLVSDSEKVIIAGFKNMLLEVGQRYLPMYLVHPDEYELILVTVVDYKSKSTKSEFVSFGLISDLLKGEPNDAKDL